MAVTVTPFAVSRILNAVARGPEVLRALEEEAELPRRRDVRWSVELLYRAWTIALREAGPERELPLEVARTSKLDEWGVLGFVVRTAPTVESALIAAARCHRLVCDRGVFAVESDDDVLALRFQSPSPGSLGEEASDLATVAYFVRGMRELSGRAIGVREVTLRRRAPRDRTRFDHFFQTRVCFGASSDTITLERSTLAHAPPQAHEPLFRHLVEEAETSLRALDPPTWAARVDQLIEHSQGAICEVEDAARALATSGRTLQRRLRDEGTSFRARRDAVLRAIAGRSLGTGRSVGEVSDALGFSDPSAFTRAHRRWFGNAPTKLGGKA